MPQPDLFKPSVLSVSELTGEIKNLLEDRFLNIQVEGEVSNANTSANGHIYFTLKDSDAQLQGVIWGSVVRRLGIELMDGQQVIAGGDIQVYPPHGKYQLIVQSIEQAGIGALQAAFEKLKVKLKNEGLFNNSHKKPVPKFPHRIGVITSETGAALHDIRDTLERRWPVAELLLHHASVQGVHAAPELVRAVNWFSERQDVDVLIIGRGGGSLEDLWPFNEEVVARALFNCKIPTVSAVGHETDYSICDFVADVRAATPTQAVIAATPDINECRIFADDLGNRLLSIISEKVRNHKERIDQLVKSHALMAIREKVINSHERVNSLTKRLNHCREMVFLKKKEALNDLRHRIVAMNPNSALEGGYVRVHQDNEWVRQAAGFDKKKAFALEWQDGKVKIGGS